MALGAYWASFFPSPYAHSSFWTSSPSFLFLRLGSVERGRRGCVRLGTAADGRPPVESAAVARAQLAVHLLDSRRDGVRHRLDAAPWRVAAPVGVGGSGRCSGSSWCVCAMVKERTVRWWKTGGFGAGGQPVDSADRNGRGVTSHSSAEVSPPGRRVRASNFLKKQGYFEGPCWIAFAPTRGREPVVPRRPRS